MHAHVIARHTAPRCVKNLWSTGDKFWTPGAGLHETRTDRHAVDSLFTRHPFRLRSTNWCPHRRKQGRCVLLVGALRVGQQTHHGSERMSSAGVPPRGKIDRRKQVFGAGGHRGPLGSRGGRSVREDCAGCSAALPQECQPSDSADSSGVVPEGAGGGRPAGQRSTIRGFPRGGTL